MSTVDTGNDERGTSAGDGDLVLDLNFVPQWARRPADAVRFARFDDAEHEGRHGGSRAGDRGGRDMRVERRSRPQADRPRRRERGAEEPVRRPEAPRMPGDAPVSRDADGGRSLPARRPVAGSESVREAMPPEVLPLNVRFLPERKPLGDLIRRISATNRAYPLLELASLLMAQEGCCYVKIEIQQQSGDFRLFQCRHCRTLALSLERMESHVMEDHLDMFFDVQEETVPPPSGVFVCVAKCGYSGVLLGPPNHHSYAEAVKRVHAERYANMDFDVYRRHIQTSHSAEDVARWKEESSKRVVYRLKATGDAMSWSDAQRHMRTEVLPGAVEQVRRTVLSEKEAHAVRDPAIRRTIRIEWQDESRFPIHLAFALRAAFRHRGLHQFKTGGGHGKGVNFVTAVKPVPMDPDTAVAEIRDALLFLRAHPGCTRVEMVEALRPGADPASDEVRSLLQPIHWLVEKGHIIEFFNGTLSVPMSSRR